MATPEHVAQLYARGQVGDAWEALADGCWQTWWGADRLIAVRVLHQHGVVTQADIQQARAWAEDPTHPEVAAYRLRLILAHRGVWAADTFRRDHEPRLRVAVTDEAAVSWACEVAAVARAVRDFSAATAALAVVGERAHPWLLVNRGYLANAQDDRVGAIRWLEAALACHQDYRPALEFLAHLHHTRADPAAAIALLEPSEARTQWGSLTNALSTAYESAGRPAEALATLERSITRMRGLTEAGRQRYLARRSDLRYLCGDRTGAVADAAASGRPWHTALATRLAAADPAARRVELAVPVVVQDHMTCAPATLAALARFHGVDADQRAVADDICYDGTPDHRERRWGEESGFLTREFTVTWAVAVELLARGLPFTLTTTAPDFAHLQAVVGFDEARGTLLIRDPGTPYWTEATAELLTDQAPFGPRGMVLAPPARQADLAAVALPDAELWDLHYQRRLALARHDRATAAVAVEALTAAAPAHRMTLFARRELAAYDRDLRARATITPLLRERYPTCISFMLMELDDLAHEGRRAAALDLLTTARDATPHPMLDRSLAIELNRDRREQERVRALVATLVHIQPHQGYTWWLWSEVLRRDGDLAGVVRATRIESCVQPWDGQAAYAHAWALHDAGDPAAGEAWLRGRWERLGIKAAEPLLTLVRYLDANDREPDVLALLTTALAAGAEPQVCGEWRLTLAKHRAWMGEGDAAEPLAAARGQVAAAAWHAAAAHVAEACGDDAGAIEHLRAQLAATPIDLDLLRQLTRIRARCDGPEAALAELRTASTRFPHNLALAELEAEFASQVSEDEHLATCERLARDFSQPWFWRELAWARFALGDLAGATEAHGRAEELAPDELASRILGGVLLARAGRRDEARTTWFAGLAQAPDAATIIRHLVAGCADAGDARAVLARIAGILRGAATGGDGLWAWAEAAERWLAPDEILAVLDEAHAQRPDLWETWALCALQHRWAGREERAIELLRGGIARFPLLSRLHLELGEVLAQRDPAAAEAAFRTAVARAPGWSRAIRALANHLSRHAVVPEAIQLLERAHRRDPRDITLLGALADLRRAAGEQAAAIELLVTACQREPDYGWGWNLLRELDPVRTRAVAEELAAARPRIPAALLRVARERSYAGDHDAASTACAALLACDPRHGEGRALAARTHAALRDFTAALAGLADPDADGVPLAQTLRECRAEILRQQGDLLAARAILTRILADDPDCFSARRDLVDLCTQLGDPLVARREADELCRRFPRSAVAYGYRADLRLGTAKEAEALPDLLCAVEYDPRYGWATNQAFRLAVAQRDLAAAEHLLAIRRRYHDSPWTQHQAVVLAIHRRIPDPDLVLLLRNLGSRVDGETLSATVEVLTSARSPKEVSDLLHRALDAEDAVALLADAWGRTLVGVGQREALRRIQTLASRPAHHEAATIGAIEAYGERPDPRDAELLCRSLVPAKPTSVALWGVRGYVWMRNERIAWTLRDLGDWRAWPTARPWMLFNLLCALRATGGFSEADAVCQAALARGEDAVIPRLHLHRAWYLAYQGQNPEARTVLQRLAATENTGQDAIYRALSEALLALEPSGRKPRSAWRHFAEAAQGWTVLFTSDAIRPAVVATGWRLVALDRSWQSWWWRAMLVLAWPFTAKPR